jgi:hypothetical protein
MTTDKSSEREAFEAWCRAGKISVSTFDHLSQAYAPGTYCDSRTWSAWLAWQARAALPQQAQEPSLPPQGAASGWKLVPVEPTDDMLSAPFSKAMENCRCEECGHSWSRGISMNKAGLVYRAMLAASPAPAPQEPAARFDEVVAAELSKVSSVPYNSHEICKWFAENVRNALYASPAPGELAQQAPSESSAQGSGVEKA